MNDIDKILESYFEGNTSLKDEQLLRDYFCQPNIKDEHKVYAPMFCFFSEERKEKEDTQNGEKGKRKHLSISIWISIAASIAILIGIYTILSLPIDRSGNQSIVYINGKKSTDMNTINNEALNSIENISDMNEDILESQIDILDSFIE